MRNAEHKGKSSIDVDRIFKAAKDTSAEGRQFLCGEICELFKDQLTTTEAQLASDIVLSLLTRIEKEFREVLAERLSLMEAVPKPVIMSLVNDELSVAAPILRNSGLLFDADLIFIIQSMAKEFQVPIAERKGMSPVVVEGLVDGGYLPALQAVVKNENVTIPDSALKKIGQHAMVHDVLQEGLLARPEVKKELASHLYHCVAAHLQRGLRDRFDLDDYDIEAASDALLDELYDDCHGRLEVTDALLTFAERALRAQDRGQEKILIKALRRGQKSYFVALLAIWAKVTPHTALAMVERKDGRDFISFARARDISKADFASLFLLTRGIRDSDVSVSHHQLSEALDTFDSIKIREAKKEFENFKLWYSTH